MHYHGFTNNHNWHSVATESGQYAYLGHLGHFFLGHMGQPDWTKTCRWPSFTKVKSAGYEE